MAEKMIVENGVSSSASDIGKEFVRQFYSKLCGDKPSDVFQFYGNDSMFNHDGVEAEGQGVIQKVIEGLGYQKSKALIFSVMVMTGKDESLIIQACGELSLSGKESRRFLQSFILGKFMTKKYYVQNDIFQWVDKAFSDSRPGSVGDSNGIAPAAPTAAKAEHHLHHNGGSDHLQPQSLIEIASAAQNVSNNTTAAQPIVPKEEEEEEKEKVAEEMINKLFQTTLPQPQPQQQEGEENSTPADDNHPSDKEQPQQQNKAAKAPPREEYGQKTWAKAVGNKGAAVPKPKGGHPTNTPRNNAQTTGNHKPSAETVLDSQQPQQKGPLASDGEMKPKENAGNTGKPFPRDKRRPHNGGTFGGPPNAQRQGGEYRSGGGGGGGGQQYHQNHRPSGGQQHNQNDRPSGGGGGGGGGGRTRYQRPWKNQNAVAADGSASGPAPAPATGE